MIGGRGAGGRSMEGKGHICTTVCKTLNNNNFFKKVVTK